MWLRSGSSLDGPQPHYQKDYGRENARRIKSLAMQRRQREAEAAAERAAKQKPLKATMAFADIKPRVTAYMNGTTTNGAARRIRPVTGKSSKGYLHGHAKTGPFLEKGSSLGDYVNPGVVTRANSRGASRLKKSKSLDASAFQDLDNGRPYMNGKGETEEPERLLHNGETSAVATNALTARFSEISVEERKARISEMVKEICETPPLVEGHMVLRRRSPSLRRRTASSTSQRHTSMENAPPSRSEAENAVRTNGISPMTRSKSMSTSTLLVNPASPAKKLPQTGSTATLDKVKRTTKDTSTSPILSPVKVPSPNRAPSRNVIPPSPAKSVHDELGLDEATKRELRLDLGGIEGALDAQGEEEDANEKKAKDVKENGRRGSLPVVKGVCVDYIHANKDGASIIGQRRRQESNRTKESKAATYAASVSSSTFAPPSTYKSGSVPKYLVDRKEQWRQAAEKKDRERREKKGCPPGHVKLTEEERMGMLGALEDRRNKLILETNRLPVSSDTLRHRNRRKEMESELISLDEEIRKYSRNVVFVANGVKPDPESWKQQMGSAAGFKEFMLDHIRKSRQQEQSSLDLTITSDGRTESAVFAHKLVLAAVSKLLASVMEESDNCSLILPDFDAAAIKKFVSVVYGESSLDSLEDADRCGVLGILVALDAFKEADFVAYESTSYRCNTCQLEFSTEEQLHSHFRLHTDDAVINERLVIECGECDAKFERDVDFAWHTHRTHGHDLEFKCFQCRGLVVGSEAELRQHQRDKHGARDRDTGIQKFKRAHRRSAKMKTTGSIIIQTPPTCSTCGKVFTNRRLLAAHKVRHGEKRMNCDLCGRGFRCSNDLYKHKTRMHAEETGLRSAYTVKCPQCPRKFADAGKQYADHLDYHAGKRSHGCGACGKKFSTRHALVEHAKKHSSKASHKCGDCGKKFKRVQNARQHLRVTHGLSGERLSKSVVSLMSKGVDRRKRIVDKAVIPP